LLFAIDGVVHSQTEREDGARMDSAATSPEPLRGYGPILMRMAPRRPLWSFLQPDLAIRKGL